MNGFGAVEAPPKREFEEVEAGAPNGEGFESFFSLVPNENPVPVGAAEVEDAPNNPEVDEGAADPKEKGVGAEGLAEVVEGSASSSIPLSPSASSVPAIEAGAGGARVPNGDAGAEGTGVGSFFSSPVGVAGVVPKVKVALGVEVEGAGLVEEEPNENAGVELSVFFGSSAGFEAPKVKGELVDGVELDVDAAAAGLKENREPLVEVESVFSTDFEGAPKEKAGLEAS